MHFRGPRASRKLREPFRSSLALQKAQQTLSAVLRLKVSGIRHAGETKFNHVRANPASGQCGGPQQSSPCVFLLDSWTGSIRCCLVRPRPGVFRSGLRPGQERWESARAIPAQKCVHPCIPAARLLVSNGSGFSRGQSRDLRGGSTCYEHLARSLCSSRYSA